MRNPGNRMVEGLVGEFLERPTMPAAVRGNFPDWLHPYLERAFGGALHEEMAALNTEAALDLRVNRLKGDREEARVALRHEDIKPVPTPWSPLGLRVRERIPLATLDAFREGLLEVVG